MKRQGRNNRHTFGEFTACSGYPRCKYIKKVVKPDPVKTGIACPVCGTGELVERINVRGRNKGTKFYACSSFPKCRATYSGLPTGDKCEVCDSPMITVEDVVRCGNERCKTNRKKKERKKQRKKNVYILRIYTKEKEKGVRGERVPFDFVSRHYRAKLALLAYVP